MAEKIAPGTTGVRVLIDLGQPGLDETDFTCFSTRLGSAEVALGAASPHDLISDPHEANHFFYIGNNKYQFDVPDEVCAVASPQPRQAIYSVKYGVDDADVANVSIDLEGSAYADTTEILTRLPNAAPGAENGLPVLDSTLSTRANLWRVFGTTLSETIGGNLAAAFKKVFDVAAGLLNFTAASKNQTGDSFVNANQLKFTGETVNANAAVTLTEEQIAAIGADVSATVLAGIAAGTYGSGPVVKQFVAKVAGVVTPGVLVACYRSYVGGVLSNQNGGTQTSLAGGLTYWFCTAGETLYFLLQKDGVTFAIETEVVPA
jgi:hypothetical protein